MQKLPLLSKCILVLFIVCNALFFTGCKKEEGLSKETGNLKASFYDKEYKSPYGSINYFIYEEFEYDKREAGLAHKRLIEGHLFQTDGNPYLSIRGLKKGVYGIYAWDNSSGPNNSAIIYVDGKITIEANKTNMFRFDEK